MAAAAEVSHDLAGSLLLFLSEETTSETKQQRITISTTSKVTLPKKITNQNHMNQKASEYYTASVPRFPSLVLE